MNDADSRSTAPAPPALFPAFLRLTGKRVLVVGAGPVAASKLKALLDAEADVTVVAPLVHSDIEAAPVTIHRRAFELSDLDGAWYVVAAAPPEVNRAVSAAAAARQLFVNAVDDPPNASVYLGAVVKREDVILAISTSGRAPALAGLLREGLDRLLPADLNAWLRVADAERVRWKAAGIPMEARRPELLRALNAIYVGQAHHEGQVEPNAESALFAPTAAPARQGLVSLVGAGPGDPELLTARAHTRLAEADVVLYDALVSPAVLALASHARCLSVGKRHGRHSVSQDTINRLLVRGARRKQRLVRLKAGDPYVFGRGGEEALALAAAGLPFEVVPGVSSAIAAPALAGIPVTHRGLASGVLVISGHAESSYAAGGRFAGAEGHDPGRPDGRQHAGPDRRPPDCPRLAGGDAGRAPLRRFDTGRAHVDRHARRPRRRGAAAAPRKPRDARRRRRRVAGRDAGPGRCGGTSSNGCRRAGGQQRVTSTGFYGSHRRSQDSRPLPSLLRHGG